MNKKTHTTTLTLLTMLIFSSAACGETPDDNGGEQPDGNNTSSTTPTGGNNQTSTTPDQTTDPEPEPMQWAGVWDVDITYTVECTESFRDDQTKTNTGSWSLALNGPNDNLTGEVGFDHQLLGTGRDDRLRLNGTFPLKGTEDRREAKGIDRETQISFSLDEIISADEARGTVSGSFETSDFVYSTCDVVSGEVVFTR